MTTRGCAIITGGLQRIRLCAIGAVSASLHLLRCKELWLFVLLHAGMASLSYADVAVIGHESLGPMDATVIGRIYTGRTVQVDGISVQPVNLKAGNPTRTAFLRMVLQQSDDDYVAYWIVRRAIGKGTPPLELTTAQVVMHYVRSTPGSIGYVDQSQLVPGVKVLLTLP